MTKKKKTSDGEDGPGSSDNLELHFGDNRDILPTMPENSVDCVFTSSPYWGLRDYGEGAGSVWDGDPDCRHEWGVSDRRLLNSSSGSGKQATNRGTMGVQNERIVSDNFCHCGAWKGQLGLEPTWQEFIDHMVEISRHLKRVLKPTGSYYLVMGDTYAGSGGAGGDYNPGGLREGQPKYKQNHYRDAVTRPKQLLLIPSRLAIALQEDGWILRNKIIWYKPNHMPSSVKDRLTNSYEEILHFVQNNKSLYWHNSRSGELTDTKPQESFYAPCLVCDGVGKAEDFFCDDCNGSGKEKIWHGHSYYYDLDSIRKPHKECTIERTRYGRDLQNQKWYGVEQPQVRHDHNPYDSPHPAGKNPGDTFIYEGDEHFHKSNTKPYPDSHFAVFPEDICIPRIKSSCPKEVCTSCGNARERMTKVVGKEITEAMRIAGCNQDGEYGGSEQKDYIGAKAQEPSQTKKRILESMSQVKETIGWTKCDCNAPFEPGVVLDPFAGSGTTGKVALDLGRKAILIEINEDYRELIERRLSVHNRIWLEKYAIQDAKENGITPLTEF